MLLAFCYRDHLFKSICRALSTVCGSKSMVVICGRRAQWVFQIRKAVYTREVLPCTSRPHSRQHLPLVGFGGWDLITAQLWIPQAYDGGKSVCFRSKNILPIIFTVGRVRAAYHRSVLISMTGLLIGLLIPNIRSILICSNFCFHRHRN